MFADNNIDNMNNNNNNNLNHHNNNYYQTAPYSKRPSSKQHTTVVAKRIERNLGQHIEQVEKTLSQIFIKNWT